MPPFKAEEIPSRSIESFLNLNSYLRHGIINNVNIINLATDMIQLGENDDSSLIEMLTLSSTKLINRLIQSKELEGILELVIREPTYENIEEILNTSTRKYFSQCKFILDLKEKFPINMIYSSIFNSIFRNAITVRQAEVITISTEKISDNFTLIIKDDGGFIPNTIVEAINDERIQFDPLIHDNGYFDLFLVKEIIKGIGNHPFSVKNGISLGCSFIISQQMRS